MDEVEPGQPTSASAPASVGAMLRAAREAQGLTIADIVARTRIPTRHLEAIELGDYAGLPSSTYAVGFAKGYARAVGLDEVAIAAQVREDVGRMSRPTHYVPYETADPSRVPSRGIAIAGLGIALAVLILVGLWYGTTLFRGGGATTAAAPAETVAEAPPTAVAPAPTPTAAPTGGQVVLAATDEVWLRVYDADNKTLYLGTMKPGEKFEVPAGAKDPMINVGRPDKLQVTLNGSAVPPLGTGERAIKDVRVGGAAIAARLSGAPTPTASTTAAETDAATAPRTSQAVPARQRKPARRLTETQRANLESAARPPGPGTASTTP